MSIINSILKAFVGDKSEKDVKAIQPLINKVKTFESALQALSHDELRAKTAEFKDKIQQARAEKDAKIASLKKDAEQTEDIDAREDIYAEIDAVEKEAYEISEKVLNEILPEAFAVVKETARRFKENTSITVTATASSAVAGDQTVNLAVTGTGITTAVAGDTLTINSSTSANTFNTISVNGQGDVVADSTTDTLTLVAGSNITLTTDPTTDQITINASAGSGGSGTVTSGLAGRIAYYSATGTTLVNTSSGLSWNNGTNTLSVQNVAITGTAGSITSTGTITAAVISKGTTLGIIEISVILKDLNNKPTIRPISAIAKINPSITLLETFSVFKSNKCPEPVILNCSKFVSMFSAT